jgi:hypothetical protein
MTTGTGIKNVEILTTLDENPQVSYFPWRLDVHDTAAGMAKSIHPNGLLSSILTDAEWAAYPGNATLDGNGQIQVADRYQVPAYIEINNNMTNVELYVAKASNDRRQGWIDAEETLKRAVKQSLGPVVHQNIRDSTVRFQRLSVADIITRVSNKYGRMEKDTKHSLKERMLTMLQTMDGLDTHISNLRELFDISTTAGFLMDEDRKVEIFRETVCAHALIVKVFESFDLEFPDSQQVTFEQIAAYLCLHLPNLKHAQLTATRAAANLVAATAYSTLESEAKRMQTELAKLKRKRPPRTNKTKNKKFNKKNGNEKGAHKSDAKSSTDAATRGSAESTANLNYCYFHGFQQSHISADCKVLNG